MVLEGIRRFLRRQYVPEERAAWDFLKDVRAAGLRVELHPTAWHEVHVPLEGQGASEGDVVKRILQMRRRQSVPVEAVTSIDSHKGKRVYKVTFGK